MLGLPVQVIAGSYCIQHSIGSYSIWNTLIYHTMWLNWHDVTVYYDFIFSRTVCVCVCVCVYVCVFSQTKYIDNSKINFQKMDRVGSTIND